MSKEGDRHAAELKRLEAKEKDLEHALMRLARDDAEARKVAESAREVKQIETQVKAARAAAKRANSHILEKTMTKTHDVRKAAAANRVNRPVLPEGCFVRSVMRP